MVVSPRVAVVAAAGQTVIAVCNYFIAAHAVSQLPALAVATVRAIGTLAVVVPLLLWMFTRGGYRLPDRAGLLRIGAVALMGVTLNPLCFVTGLAWTNPARAALLYGLTPVVVLLWSVLLGRERNHRSRWIGVAVALVGVCLVLADRGGLRHDSLRGDLILLVGTVLWAGYTAVGKPVVDRYGPAVVTPLALLIGFSLFLPYGVPQVAWGAVMAASPAFWAAMAYIVLLNTVLAYALWYVAIRGLPASRVAIFNNLQPVATVLLSWGLFAVPVDATMWVGAALTVAGVATTQLLGGSTVAAAEPRSASRSST